YSKIPPSRIDLTCAAFINHAYYGVGKKCCKSKAFRVCISLVFWPYRINEFRKTKIGVAISYSRFYITDIDQMRCVDMNIRFNGSCIFFWPDRIAKLRKIKVWIDVCCGSFYKKFLHFMQRIDSSI